MHSVKMFLKACTFIVLVVAINTAPVEYIIEIEWTDPDFEGMCNCLIIFFFVAMILLETS